MLTSLNCSEDSKYYNRTNNSLPGYKETPEEKKIRMNKTHEYRRIHGFKMPEDKKLYGTKNHMFGKTHLEFWIKKYGEEVGRLKWEEKKNKSSQQMKDNNPCKKFINEELFFQIVKLSVKGLKRQEIADNLNVNYWLVARYGKRCIIEKYLNGDLKEGTKINWTEIQK